MKARDLVPQIVAPRVVTLEKFYEGSHLVLWGLFQKVFVADNLARIVDPVFNAGPPYHGVQVLLALYAFAFQIFCDFAGYSNIARGLGKCMGFEIMINFNLPYFATNPKEFWQRWHISLSTWLRDYLYIPLGGSRNGTLLTYRNLAITMLIGGLWHGAKWTFVAWGAYQGTLLILHRLCEPVLDAVPAPKGAVSGRVWYALKAVFFFHLVCVGWLLFRAQSMTQVFAMLSGLVSGWGYDPALNIAGMALDILFFTWLLLGVQCVQHSRNDQMAVYKWPSWARGLVYLTIVLSLMVAGASGGKEFIYFQF